MHHCTLKHALIKPTQFHARYLVRGGQCVKFELLCCVVALCMAVSPDIVLYNPGPAAVGVQCPITSSLVEFPGYWDWLRYPGLPPVLVSFSPLRFISRCFSIHSSPAIGFLQCFFFMTDVSAPIQSLTLYIIYYYFLKFLNLWMTVTPESLICMGCFACVMVIFVFISNPAVISQFVFGELMVLLDISSHVH